MPGYDEPVYLISIVSTMLDIHPQTLRQYERDGLIEPSRTKGGIRLYSQRDIDKMKVILRLTRDLGVNLAGVDIILNLKEQMDEMEEVINSLRDELSSKNRSTSDNKEKSILIKKTKYDIVQRKRHYSLVIFKEEN